MNRYVPLSRKFSTVPAAYQTSDFEFDETWSVLLSGEQKGWDELLGQYRVVILAEAGAGKTYELRLAAERVVADDRPAFFIRIEDIDQDFAGAFEIGSAGAFDAWLAGTGEAWFFLDSVDEVRLTDPRAFERAIRTFAASIRDARHRAHVFISSRPYAWRAALDRALIEEVLPLQADRQEAVGGGEEEGDDFAAVETDFETTASAPGTKDRPALVDLYMLAPLQEAEIRFFAEARGVRDGAQFLEALKRTALLPLARMPFDLQELIGRWIDHADFATRLEVLQDGVRRHLRGFDDTDGAPSAAQALKAAQLLAITTLLSGQVNFRLPGASGAQGVDVGPLLPGWSAQAITSLLGTGLFSEPIYGQVRFRHREIRELLAASWLKAQLTSDLRRHEIQAMIFRSQYGETTLGPRLRPVLPWLILLDAQIRDLTLAQHPEVAVEGGDAALLPLETRSAMLAALIAQIIEPQFGLQGLDNAEIARIAQPDLEDQTLALVRRHLHNDDAIFVLGRLVWQGRMHRCLPDLRSVATDAARGIYARLVSIRAIGSLVEPSAFASLWQALNNDPAALPRRLLAELIEYAPANAQSVDLILASLARSQPRERYEATGLESALHQFIQRLSSLTAQACDCVFRLVSGLAGLLAQEPYVERRECKVSTDNAWLMGPALHGLEILVIARAPTALSDVALTVLAASALLKHWGDHDFEERKSVIADLVPTWPALNDALFWWTVAERRAGLSAPDEVIIDDWPVTWIGHYWRFDETSFPRTLGWIRTRALPDDRLVALARTVRTYQEAGKPDRLLDQLRAAVAGDSALQATLSLKLDPPPVADLERHRVSRQERRQKKRRREVRDLRARADFVAKIVAAPQDIRHPPGLKPGAFSGGQYNLLRIIEGEGLRRSRAQGADWRHLIPEFGIEVAEAYRDGAVGFWRRFKPGVASEGANTRSTPYALIFAMAGLDIELGDGTGAAHLSSKDAARAARYGLWELNGFPRWFESLYRARPVATRNFLWREVCWELDNSPADEPMHYILDKLVYFGAWAYGALGPLILDWLRNNHAPNTQALDHCRTIMMGGGVAAADLADLAVRKLEDAGTPADQAPIWHALRIDADPARAILALQRLFDSGRLERPDVFGAQLCVALIGDRRNVSPVFGGFKTPSYLKDLYVLVHQAVRVDDDIERAGTGVYSPTLRDGAQEARERLFSLLSGIRGELTYRTIKQLAHAHPEPRFRKYMSTQAYRRAEVDGDLPSWPVADIADLAHRFEAAAALGGRPDAAA
ncbi:hypothetical protein PMI01_02777 [Caulobacter sp. AP07]|uniref:NACHT domain-containing protein n=1 Tax=Caulobacter sp. AP07 TaxID=1144304 RepID=UPI0002721B38|nr:hypothetical protein [Caulobacter sp. AP07]EJL31538.1 hypothetical protein PMI01_02777 [Caulobacter sp. AP07]